ncbi:hypothetical protein Cyast_2453 [Cyanobacterium stanieri PCC 7202]|uniref:DUF2442 domain-containing protein n=1 Tax=Cyanobacterium stanieri (strain ATCC 29140 / PCC 7202) TaxID=292563 RepID=K9YPK5_CYASC|nr:hypothetical protein Cyast_2453 [Cyanobacterium stanieri PCC 7202]
MEKLHHIEKIEFHNDYLILSVDNKHYSFPLSEISQKLLNATEIERNLYRVSASGYGIHWLTLDEDLSIDGLLKLRQYDQPSALLQ